MNKKEFKFPEIILKSLFNKDLNKATARELEKFISKKMPKNDKENSLIKYYLVKKNQNHIEI